jgi:hypothetical protein
MLQGCAAAVDLPVVVIGNRLTRRSAMKPEYLSLITGFVGAGLGAMVTLLSVWLQQRAQERRDRARLSLDAAIKALDSDEKYAQFAASQGRCVVTHPLDYYIMRHSKLVEYMASGQPITREQIVTTHKQAIEIVDAIDEYNRQRATLTSSNPTDNPVNHRP